jgi:predicted GIY-YIG superfamily endonuclease
MSTIYVLRLHYNKYYVGKTNNLRKTYEEHVNGEGAAWTRKYLPISIEKSMPATSPLDEDNVTKEYMARHGINSVRGGSYVSDVLEDVQYQSIQRELWAAMDCCTLCGRRGHFVKHCRVRSIVVHTRKPVVQKEQSILCYRCGHIGHYATTCYVDCDNESGSEYT